MLKKIAPLTALAVLVASLGFASDINTNAADGKISQIIIADEEATCEGCEGVIKPAEQSGALAVNEEVKEEVEKVAAAEETVLAADDTKKAPVKKDDKKSSDNDDDEDDDEDDDDEDENLLLAHHGDENAHADEDANADAVNEASLV